MKFYSFFSNKAVAVLVLSLFFITLSFYLYSFENKDLLRRAEASLKLKEPQLVLKEVEEALKKEPLNPLIHQIYVRLLASAGKEDESIKAYLNCQNLISNELEKREMLEEISWGIIRKAKNSSLLIARLMSLVAATITQDAYSVDLIDEAINCSNFLIRKIAVDLSCYLLDMGLQKKVMALMQEDCQYEVRLECIKAIGKMRLSSAEALLRNSLLNDSKLDCNQRAALIQSIVAIHEKATDEEIKNLARNNRAAFRQLAAALAERESSAGSIETLLTLINDTSREVRIVALSALASVRYKGGINFDHILAQTRPLIQNNDFLVSITACYLNILLDDFDSKEKLFQLCFHSSGEIRRLAATALSMCGKNGLETMVRVINESHDHFVKIPLSVTLASFGLHVTQSLDNLFIFLNCETCNIMTDDSQHPLFTVICPSLVKRSSDPLAPSPESCDIFLRLELLKMLAIFEYPSTKEILRKFLKEKDFGVTLTAAATLISEGSGEDVDCIKDLLYDSDYKVRLQAALVLALWSKDYEPVQVMQELYPKLDREMKMRVLEAIANVGSKESIPFLLKVMQDPYQVIRIIGASALIICLNH
jgi:HEAT repeat protein